MIIRAAFILVSVCLYGVKCSTRQDEQILHDQLFMSYNRDLGPMSNREEPITLYTSYNLLTLQEFNDKSGKLAILGISSFEWNDDRMVWNPLRHGNITSISVPESKVWIPKLVIVKPFSTVKRIGDDFVMVMYSADGTASWDVPDLFEVACTANVAYYPFDRQLCEIYIIPWSYPNNPFDLQLPYYAMTQVQFIENGIWEVLSTKLSIQSDSNGDFVHMTIKFQRRPLFIMVNLILPIVVIGFLNVLVFLLPPDPGERSAFGVTVLLAMAVFLSIVSDKLPSTSEPHIPRISIYLLVQLIISALVMVFVMSGLVLYNKKEDEPIPKWITKIVRICSKRKKLLDTRSRPSVTSVPESNRTGMRNNPEKQGNDQNSHGNITDKCKCKFNSKDSRDQLIGYRGHPNSYREQYNSCNDSLIEHRYRGHPSDYRNINIPHITRRQHYSDDMLPGQQATIKSKSHEQINDKQLEVTWIDVAKWFDNFCLALFILLNLISLILEIVDGSYYMLQEF